MASTPSDSDRPDEATPKESAAAAADSTRATDAKGALSPALLATLIAIPVMVIAGFITFAALNFSSDDDAEVPVDSYATTTAEGADECPAFLAALPEDLGDFGGKSVDGTTARWTKADSDPVVVRCGVARPEELAPTSALQVIDPVQWFITDTVEGRGQAYVSVDHRPYVAVWVPAGAGNAPITDVSALVQKTLTRAPLDFGR